jgi:large subunit ribosomal protein L29|tara:strand:- start:1922 stop:2113 length:192 start_codon:yes stop_codon:yes gene_type:complete
MKMNEIRNLSQEELSKQFSALSKELADMKMKNRITPLENPMRIASTRKIVARLTMEMSNRNSK